MLYTCTLKGTVSVILDDPPCKDGNARFTTIPLKPLCDQKFEKDIVVFLKIFDDNL